MEFDRTEFLSKYLRRGPEVLADELHALHAEIDVLKARLPEPEPERETGWAVVDDDGYPLTLDRSFVAKGSGGKIFWLDGEEQAKLGARILNLTSEYRTCRAAMLYKDTLKEVG